MSFKRYEPRFNGDCEYVTLNTNGITLSNKLWESLNRAERIVIYYDKDINQLKVACDETGLKFKSYRGQIRSSAKLIHIMPKGRYYKTGETYTLFAGVESLSGNPNKQSSETK